MGATLWHRLVMCGGFFSWVGRALPLAVLTSTLLPVESRSQVDPDVEQRIDAIFSAWDRADSPGAAVAVVRGGRLVFAKGYGSAQLEYRIPITPQTPFHVASEAKQFTAAGVLLLAERGTLDLDDDVRRWIPEIPDFGTSITIRHLLNHTSGLRDQWQALALAGRYGDDAITTDDVLRMVTRQRALNFSPGATELYSNTGYTLLAEVVERASGQSFRDFAYQEIFEPLGMTRTHFHDDLEEPIAGRAYSYGHAAGSERFERRILNYAVPGPTSLFTTVEDMARWLANFDDPVVGGPEIMERLHTRDTLNDGDEVLWGYGLNIGEHRGLVRIGHGGGDAGFRAWSVRFPDHDLGIVVLANSSSINPGPFGDALALAVADLFLPAAVAPDEPAASAPEGPTIEEDDYVGSYAGHDGRVVNVTNEYGVLKAWEPQAEDKVALEPITATEFRAIADSIGRVEFAIENGRPARLRIEGAGWTWEGRPVEPVAPAGLDAVVGRYYSDELETMWALALDESGGLVARHLMHEDIPLTPVVRDLFEGDAWFLQEVRIVRGKHREVIGLRVSAGRIKNVELRRIGSS